MPEFTVIPERASLPPEPDRWVYHLMTGEWDPEAWWQPIKCGGGIALPHRETVPGSDVCPDCLRADL